MDYHSLQSSQMPSDKFLWQLFLKRVNRCFCGWFPCCSRQSAWVWHRHCLTGFRVPWHLRAFLLRMDPLSSTRSYVRREDFCEYRWQGWATVQGCFPLILHRRRVLQPLKHPGSMCMQAVWSMETQWCIYRPQALCALLQDHLLSWQKEYRIQAYFRYRRYLQHRYLAVRRADEWDHRWKALIQIHQAWYVLPQHPWCRDCRF